MKKLHVIIAAGILVAAALSGTCFAADAPGQNSPAVVSPSGKLVESPAARPAPQPVPNPCPNCPSDKKRTEGSSNLPAGGNKVQILPGAEKKNPCKNCPAETSASSTPAVPDPSPARMPRISSPGVPRTAPQEPASGGGNINANKAPTSATDPSSPEKVATAAPPRQKAVRVRVDSSTTTWTPVPATGGAAAAQPVQGKK
jgi:hypothetical protein